MNTCIHTYIHTHPCTHAILPTHTSTHTRCSNPSVKQRFEECHDPSNIRWYEGCANYGLTLAPSERQNQPILRSENGTPINGRLKESAELANFERKVTHVRDRYVGCENMYTIYLSLFRTHTHTHKRVHIHTHAYTYTRTHIHSSDKYISSRYNVAEYMKIFLTSYSHLGVHMCEVWENTYDTMQ